MNWDPLSSGPLVRINLSFLEVYVRRPLLLYSVSTEVLPGPPKYLPHQYPHRARLVPEIMPEIVPDPPLHSAQIILEGFRYFLAEMYLGTLKGGSGTISGTISGSSKVLPGPPRYLPYRFPQGFDLVPKIVKFLTPRSREQLKTFLNPRRKIPQTSQVCFDASKGSCPLPLHVNVLSRLADAACSANVADFKAATF